MAKKNSEIRKKSLNFLDFLKHLTNYLKSNNRNTDQFIQVINKHQVDKNFLFKRAISHNYNNPHIIWYVNKYLNNKFDFYNYDIKEYLLSLTFVMDQHNQKRLFFLKSKDLKDPNKFKIKKTLKEYYLIVKRKYLNDDELNYLYSLFSQKLITVKEIENMDIVLNGPKSKIKLDLDFIELQNQESTSLNEKQSINEYIEYVKTIPLSDEIYNFTQEMKNKKIERDKCQDCKLFNNQMVVLDTNRETIGPVDFMFVALSPGKNEAIYNRLFVGKSGRLFREKMYYLDKNITWLMTNVMMCSANNQKDIANTAKQIKLACNNCSDFLSEIINKFPAKIYVPIGKQAIEFFGITGSVTQNSGQVSKKANGSIILPLIHPSAILQNESNKPLYNSSWNTIFQVATKLTQNKKAKSVNVVENIHQEIKAPVSVPAPPISKNPIVGHSNYNVPDHKWISIIDDTLTYFDSINLDNQNILNVYIDKDGEKKYKLEEFKMPVYIKSCPLNERKMINNGDFDYVSYIDGRTRYRLSKVLKDNLIKHKQLSIQTD